MNDSERLARDIGGDVVKIYLNNLDCDYAKGYITGIYNIGNEIVIKLNFIGKNDNVISGYKIFKLSNIKTITCYKADQLVVSLPWEAVYRYE